MYDSMAAAEKGPITCSSERAAEATAAAREVCSAAYGLAGKAPSTSMPRLVCL